MTVSLLPAAFVTETFFSIIDWRAFVADRAAHQAIQAWCKTHGLDPSEIYAGPIHRDVEHCRVVYIGRDDWSQDALRGCWTTCVQQGETPPMPWPEELDRYRAEPGTLAAVLDQNAEDSLHQGWASWQGGNP